MDNIIKKGLGWLDTKLEGSVVEPVVVTYKDSQDVQCTRRLTATVIEPESRVNSDGVRVQSDTFTFLIQRDKLKGITLKRGIKFKRVNYELDFVAVNQDRTFDDYNDPNLNRIAVPAKLCS